MLNAMDHAADLCCTSTVKAADCAPPTKFIHAVSDSGAGYFFIVIPYVVHIYSLSFLISQRKIFSIETCEKAHRCLDTCSSYPGRCSDNVGFMFPLT
jgi:hypothetical protein